MDTVNKVINISSKYIVKGGKLSYKFPITIHDKLSKFLDDDTIVGWGIYYEMGYFTAKEILCNKVTLFITLNKEPTEEFITVLREDIANATGELEIITEYNESDMSDDTFSIITPLTYSNDLNVIYNPEITQNKLTEEIGEPVKFKNKWRNIKSMMSTLGNVWGYSGKIYTNKSVTIKHFCFGDNPLLYKNGYNCIVPLKLL